MIIKTKHAGYSADGLRRLHIPGLFQQDAPDTSGMNKAAELNAAIGKESLDWMKQVYADGADDRAAASSRASAVSDAQLLAMQKQTALTDDLTGYNKATFRPLEQGIVADAQTFDSPEREAANVAKATSGVQSEFDNTEAQQRRQLARQGVQPGSAKALMLSQGLATTKASALAGAAYKARTDTETLGYARKMDAASLGRGLSSAQATSAGLALNAGNSSVGNAQVPLAVTQGGVSQMQSGYGQAMGANSSAASIYGNIGSLQNQANANETAYMKAMMDVGTSAYGAYQSDKNVKTDRKKFSGKLALSMIKRMPVESWKYKPGVADGGHHIGPMAQDVQKAAGDNVAPGGKMIDAISLHGLSLAAVQELDKRLITLERKPLALAEARR